MIENTAFVHPFAVVEAGCYVGSGSKVWQFASVTRGAQIGADCVVAPGAMVDGSEVDDGSKIGPGVKMGPGFRIGLRCFLGPNVVLCNDAWPRADVTGWEIEQFTSGKLVTVIVDDEASIFAGAIILPGVRIGKGAAVAAGAVCGRDVPDRHLFKRDGSIVEINSAWSRRRMVRAKAA